MRLWTVRTGKSYRLIHYFNMPAHKDFPNANAEYVKDFNKRNLAGLTLPPGKKVWYLLYQILTAGANVKLFLAHCW